MQSHTRMHSLPVSYERSCALVLWLWNVMSPVASLSSQRISWGYRILSTIWSDCWMMKVGGPANSTFYYVGPTTAKPFQFGIAVHRKALNSMSQSDMDIDRF